MRLPGSQTPQLCLKFSGTLLSGHYTVPLKELPACDMSLSSAVCATGKLEQTSRASLRIHHENNEAGVHSTC